MARTSNKDKLEERINQTLASQFDKYIEKCYQIDKENYDRTMNKVLCLIFTSSFITIDYKKLIDFSKPEGVSNLDFQRAIARKLVEITTPLRKKYKRQIESQNAHFRETFVSQVATELASPNTETNSLNLDQYSSIFSPVQVKSEPMDSEWSAPLKMARREKRTDSGICSATSTLQQNDFFINSKPDASKQVKREAKQCQSKKRKRNDDWTEPEKMVSKSCSNANSSKRVSNTYQACKASLENSKKKISEYLFGSEESDQADESDETDHANVDESIANNLNTENQTSDLVESTKIYHSSRTSLYLPTNNCIELNSNESNEDLYCSDEDIEDEDEKDHILAEEEVTDKPKCLFKLSCQEQDFTSLKNCSVVLHNKRDLDNHATQKHNRKVNVCLVCIETFHQRHELDLHIERKHANHEQWICAKCNNQFTNHNYLRHHVWRHHYKGDFGCPYPGCLFLCEYRDHLSKHKDAVHKKFVCKANFCGKRFPTETSAYRHLQSHTEMKPYYCKECHSSFKYKGNAIKHVRTKHFQLPITQKEQHARGIYDNRDPMNLIEEARDELKRRKNEMDHHFRLFIKRLNDHDEVNRNERPQ